MASEIQGGDWRQINWDKQNLRFERRYLNVDARARKNPRTSSRSDFKIDLPEKFRNLLYAKLISAEIPKTDFNVYGPDNLGGVANNRFTLVDNGNTYNIDIPPCDYDINSFISTVQNLINTQTSPVPPSNAYSITVECGKLIITGSGGVLPFQLLFATGEGSDEIQNVVCQGFQDQGSAQIIKNQSAREVMGFDIEDYTSVGDPQGVINAPFKVDLLGEAYLTLKIFSGNNTNSFETYNALDQTTDGAFFIIPLTSCTNNITYITNQYLNIQKTFPVPLSKVKELRFQFLGYYGRLYNFQGHDPALQLEIGTLI